MKKPAARQAFTDVKNEVIQSGIYLSPRAEELSLGWIRLLSDLLKVGLFDGERTKPLSSIESGS